MEPDSQSDEFAFATSNSNSSHGHGQPNQNPQFVDISIVQALQTQIDGYDGQIKLMQAQLDTQNDKMARYKQKIKDLTKEVGELKLKLNEKEKEREKEEQVPAPSPSTSSSVPVVHHDIHDGLSIAEIAKMTAEQTLQEIQANQKSEFVWDERSGLYYDYASQYYYDPVKQLYYNGHTKTYYHMDIETNNLIYHSCVDDYPASCEKPNDTADNDKKNLTKKKKKKKKDKKNKAELEKLVKVMKEQSNIKIEVEEIEEGELSNASSSFESSEKDSAGSSSSESSSSSVVSVWSSDNDQEKRHKTKRTKNKKGACIRAIVQDSQTLNKGYLFVVTILGGSIGKENLSHAIIINETGVSKEHALITNKKNQYFIQDLGSQNGTFLNGTRLSESKVRSEENELPHGSTLKIGGTTLLIHIHPGTITCIECEPGLVQIDNTLSPSATQEVTILTQKDKERLRKKEMNKLRKKYNIGNYSEAVKLPDNYSDRAETRRIELGSDNPYEKTQVASVDSAIPESNKGFKLMEKMGYKSGESLGKAQEGIVEPIRVEVKNNRGGLGSLAVSSFTPFKTKNDGEDSAGLVTNKNRQEVIAKTHKRFKEAKLKFDE